MLNPTVYGKICVVCGRGFSTPHATKVYCSMECSYQKRRAYQDAEPIRIKIALLEEIMHEAQQDISRGGSLVSAHARAIASHLATLRREMI